MTAYASLDIAVKAIQQDVYDFLSKPIDQPYLIRSLYKAIEKRNLSEENKRLISFLKKSNVSLERSDRMKSKFLSIVTHDLRTPLTSVNGYCQMLNSNEVGLTGEEKGKCFEAIDRSIKRMNGLITSLMDIISIEAGNLRVEKSPIDFIAICEELKGSLLPITASHGATLQWQLPRGSLIIMADSDRIMQVLTNIISNAFKHTPAEGKIIVRASLNDKPGSSPGSARVILTEVIDNGEGIAPENQARIFEQFFQVEVSPTRREGLGLGLSIAKEIVRAHQGEIGVSSEGLGKGSRFWFTLPFISS
jgi:signal transduction histidine kinase